MGRLLIIGALAVAMARAAVAQDVTPQRIASLVGHAVWCGNDAVAYNVEAWRGPRADSGSFVKTLATGETRRVSLRAEDAPISCSPDGRFVVYASFRTPSQVRLLDQASDLDTELAINVSGFRWARSGEEIAVSSNLSGGGIMRFTPPHGVRSLWVPAVGAEFVWAANRVAILNTASVLSIVDGTRPAPGTQRYELPVAKAGNLRADHAGNLYVRALAAPDATRSSVFRCDADAPSTCTLLLRDHGETFTFDVMPDGSLVFMSDAERNCLVVLNVRSGRQSCRLAGRWSVLGVSGDGRNLLVVDSDGVLAVVAITGALDPG